MIFKNIIYLYIVLTYFIVAIPKETTKEKEGFKVEKVFSVNTKMDEIETFIKENNDSNWFLYIESNASFISPYYKKNVHGEYEFTLISKSKNDNKLFINENNKQFINTNLLLKQKQNTIYSFLFQKMLEFVKKNLNKEPELYSFLSLDKEIYEKQIVNYGYNFNIGIEKFLAHYLYHFKKKTVAPKFVISNETNVNFHIINFEQPSFIGNNKNYENENNLYYLTKQNNLIAFLRLVNYINIDKKKPSFAFIALFFVSKEYRKNKYSDILIEQLLIDIKERNKSLNNCNKIEYIEFQTNNPLIKKLAEKHNAILIKTHENIYYYKLFLRD